MYSPTGRVLTVLELLQSRPGLTGPELASRLETDVRTVRRYITKLQDVGIPVESNPGRFGGYRLRPGYKLPPLIFDEQEATAIVLGLIGSSWLQVEQSPAAVEGALSKITRVLPQTARDRLLAMSAVMVMTGGDEGPRPDASLLLLLNDAILSRRCIRLRYLSDRGETTDRTVEPYGLVGRQGRWYLVGWCRLRTDYRTFRLDRIATANPEEERFNRDEKFDFRAYAKKQLETFPVKWHLSVLFTAQPARVRDRIPATIGKLTETTGGVRFEWGLDDLYYGARYLMERGLPFVVEEPEEFRAAMRKLAAEAARIAGA